MNKVELVQKGYQYFSEGKIDSLLELFHRDIIWEECQGFPFIAGDGIFKGPEAVAQGVLSQLPAHYDGFSIDIQELFGCGEKVVMVGHFRGDLQRNRQAFQGKRYSCVDRQRRQTGALFPGCGYGGDYQSTCIVSFSFTKRRLTCIV